MKKQMALLWAAVFAFGAFAGCGGASSGATEKIDKSRTQLYVSVFNGGIGTAWMESIEQAFETANSEICFEPGTDKKGVQIIATPSTENGKQMATKGLASYTDEVFFTEIIPYYDWVKNGLIADISDVVSSVAATGEGTIASKLNQQQQDNLAVDGKYYALPHYETYMGVSYDVSLFESKLLYFSANPDNGNNGFITSKTEKRSMGPDGKTGVQNGIDYSLDDGLPSTYEEFFKLCDYMVVRNVTPFVWPGSAAESYTSYLLEAVSNAYSTKTEMMLPLTMDSGEETVRVISEFDEKGNPVISNVTVDEETGYYVFERAGQYYALDFLNKVLSNKKYYYTRSTDTTFTQYNSQEQFIFSSLENKPIGMLIDGTWWTNEAAGAFERSVSSYGERAENRKFAWMPLPRKATANDTVGEEYALKDALRSYAFINGNVKNENKLKLAKEFLKFCYSDEALQSFTLSTGVAKGVKYSLTSTQKSSLSYYAQNVWDYRSAYDVVYNLSSNDIFMNDENTFITDFWSSKVSGTDYLFPYTAFRASSSMTAAQYFKGMKISASSWESEYGKYYK